MTGLADRPAVRANSTDPGLRKARPGRAPRLTPLTARD